MTKNKKPIPLNSIDYDDINDINNEVYGIMYDYSLMTCKNNVLMAEEVLHQTIIKFYDYQSKYPDIKLRGGMLALIFRSVKFDYYRSIKPTTEDKILNSIVDDYDETYQLKKDEEEQYKMIEDVLSELPEYQQNLFIYSHSIPSTIIAEVTGGNLTKIRQEINNIKTYIKTKIKQKYGK